VVSDDERSEARGRTAGGRAQAPFRLASATCLRASELSTVGGRLLGRLARRRRVAVDEPDRAKPQTVKSNHRRWST
jgi:hypothetical protein